MSGYLPGTRPDSATYADDFADEKPVEKPDTELPADVFNKMKADLAYCARTTSLLRIQITNDGVSATVAAVTGPEGVLTSNVVATRTATGRVSVDWSATGVSAVDALGSCRSNATFGMLLTRSVASGSVDVATLNNSGADFDTDFTLWVF